jgi:hypothetical protein
MLEFLRCFLLQQEFFSFNFSNFFNSRIAAAIASASAFAAAAKRFALHLVLL